MPAFNEQQASTRPDGAVTRPHSRPDADRSVPSTVRVTHVVFDFDGGGLETLVAQMAMRFAGTSVCVSLVSLSGRAGRLGTATRDRFDQFHVMRPSRAVSMLLPLGLARAIRQTRADVVHLHNASWYKGALAARLAGVRRVVYTEHGREHNDPPLMRLIDRQASRFTTAVIAVSRRLAGYLEREVGVAHRKIRVIHSGVDTDLFTPGQVSTEFRASLGVPAGAVVIGSLGRLESVKAYEHLLEAAAIVRQKIARPFVILLCGDGSERAALEAQAQRLGIGDIVLMPGWTSQGVQTQRLIDLFVLPSRSEGQSVSLMEAMACGAIPVVTDVGANAEMLGPKLQHHLVPVARPDVLAERLIEMLDPTAPVEEIRSEVRKRAVDLYSLNRMVNDYERLYRETNAKPR